ncbi:MAG: penicillin-binding protein, partial [Mesorhizobium sp.]
PGTWRSTPADTIVQDEIPSNTPQPAPVPSASVSQSAPSAQKASSPRAVRPAETVDGGGFGMPGGDSTTASIKRPVPPGDVGGPVKKRQTSIFDILTGG